jgi:hypothetical protein
LTATQARLSQSDARACDGDVLDDFVFTLTARARHRFGVSFDDGGADDRQRPFCRATQLELEQALTSLLKLALRAFGFTSLASWSRFLGHLAQPPE